MKAIEAGKVVYIYSRTGKTLIVRETEDGALKVEVSPVEVIWTQDIR